MTISLNLIVKNEEDKIKKALDSIYKYVDEICITDTGSTDKTIEVLESLEYPVKIKISHFNPTTHPEAFFPDGSIYSFCQARNFNFAQATSEWILWMDADDMFHNPQNLKALLEAAEKNDLSGYYFQYHYLLKDGRPTETHWKLQMIKNDGHGKWKGNIHEDFLPDKFIKYANTEAVQRVHIMGNPDDPKKHERNLKILMRELQEQGDTPDPRTLFYTGRAFVTTGEYESAIPLLEKYCELSGYKEELYEGMYLLAECYMEMKQYDEARKVCHRGIELRPATPDLYYSMARVYLYEQDYLTAKEWLEIGFQRKDTQGNVTNFPHRYTTQPLSLYAVALMYLGKLDDAFNSINKALKHSPKDKHLEGIRNLIAFTKKRKDVASAYATIASYMIETKEEWKIRTLLGTIHQELNPNPIISKLKSDHCPPKEWKKKSIAFLALGAVEAWSPKNEKVGGIGGSEEAVINLSRELKKLGWDVTVYTNTGTDDGVYDGVVWKMFTELNGKDKFDRMILWRASGLLDFKWDAQRVLFDMHDVPMFGMWEGKTDLVNKIMVKSEYHKSLMPDVPVEKFNVIGNGINPSHFSKPIIREEFRCIYASTIDRGLDILLNNWHKIREQVPEATLHIYYGFKTYKELNKHNPERMRYVNKIEQQLKDLEPLGVTYHGRVDHITLAEEFMKSDVWLYPTYFPEIHCITAAKAQAAGAIPVCTNYAALDTTVQYGKKLEGDIYLPEVQEEFVKTAVEVLKDKQYKEETRKLMIPWALDYFAWSKVAKNWSDELNGDSK